MNTYYSIRVEPFNRNWGKQVIVTVLNFGEEVCSYRFDSHKDFQYNFEILFEEFPSELRPEISTLIKLAFYEEWDDDFEGRYCHLNGPFEYDVVKRITTPILPDTRRFLFTTYGDRHTISLL